MVINIMSINHYCSICLQTNDGLTHVNDLDDNNSTKTSDKIKSILPEFEHIEDYFICKACTQKLDDFFEFKRLLHNFLDRWKNIEKPESDNTRDFSENFAEQPVTDCISIKEEPIIINVGKQYLKQEIICEEVEINETLVETNSSIDTLDKNNISKIKGYECNLCCNFYTSQANLQKHKKHCMKEDLVRDARVEDFPSVVTKEKVLTKSTKPRGRKTKSLVSCQICEDTFSYMKHLLEHCKNNHSLETKQVKPYKCLHCENRFTSLPTFNQHLKYHEKKRSKICTICGKTFITASDLIVHEYTHLNKRNYKCTQCEKAFNTNKNLRTHILVVHTDRSLWKYKCTVCGKSFPLKVNYDQHCRRHNGEKFHICHFCEKSFVSNSELKRHVELHSNIKRFKCIPCNKDYKSRRTYKVHMDRKHSDGHYKAPVREKKYICHICPSQFYDKPKLLRHLCSHSGLKPFGCTICGKKFTDKSYVKHHNKIAHKVVDSIIYSNISTV